MWAATPNFLESATSPEPVLQMLASHCHYSRNQEASTLWIPRRKTREFKEDSNTPSQWLVGVFTGAEPGTPLVFPPSFVRACSDPEGIKATGEASRLPHLDPKLPETGLDIWNECRDPGASSGLDADLKPQPQRRERVSSWTRAYIPH